MQGRKEQRSKEEEEGAMEPNRRTLSKHVGSTTVHQVITFPIFDGLKNLARRAAQIFRERSSIRLHFSFFLLFAFLFFATLHRFVLNFDFIFQISVHLAALVDQFTNFSERRSALGRVLLTPV